MTYHDSPPRVAYFCMEYGLHESFPIYAGGLGILAGDVLKAARDLGVPFVGIGILWREGYTSQFIGEGDWPYDTFPRVDTAVLQDTGVQVWVKIYGQNVPVKVWKTQAFGNAPLYLLDTDVPGSEFAWVSQRLYGGSGHDRVAQEIVLGIGGIRAIRALDLNIEVFHFNEGHAVLAGLELIREKMNTGASFEWAWEKTREEIVFTTHTPVMAGNESHGYDLIFQLGADDGLTKEQLHRIGGDPFNMTIAGLRLSHIANGVSKLHGLTARSMWQDVTEHAPILAITNGVHQRTWQNQLIRQAFESNQDLWEPHQQAKNALIQEVRTSTGTELSADNLLVGFARRAAPYKRSDLIFSRPEIIEPLLQERKIQLIFSGKSHPQDHAGKGIVSHIVRMTRRYPQAVAFLENYDMRIGRLLTSGCDVWLNNPRRPLEASGTSGMKAALNGVLNLSILDGWWPEGCLHGVNGWQFGGGYDGTGQESHDLVSLLDVLLNEVVPAYYHDRARWTRMMRASIEMAIGMFTSQRMLREYYTLLYQPASTRKRMIQEISKISV